ncbi:hypothetical protein [Nostoc sp.]|uniref:hypothetical protein n=1 Tax=Nostoc sp. TaxID=1180 RepID=UPI002FF89F58
MLCKSHPVNSTSIAAIAPPVPYSGQQNFGVSAQSNAQSTRWIIYLLEIPSYRLY